MTKISPSFEERQKKSKKRIADKINNAPVIAMAYYKMGDIATLKLQVINITKRSVTMRAIRGGCTIKLSVKSGDIDDFVQIDRNPPNTTPLLIKDGTIGEIPQGSDVPL